MKIPLLWRHVVTICAVFSCCPPLEAQQSAVLEGYIQQAFEHNLSLNQQHLEILKARASVREARSLSSLRLNFDANYTLAAGGRKLDFPIGDLLNPVYSTLNQLTQSNAFPQVQNAEIQFLPNNFHETKISFSYPLYNSDLKFNRKIQSGILDAQEAARAAGEHQLRFDITQAYLQYLQAVQGEKIWQNSRKVLLELKRFNESLVKNNVATREVVATADYEISKADNEIFGLQSRQNSARAYFNMLVDGNFDRELTADTALLSAPVPEYDLKKLLDDAAAKRQELSALQTSVSVAQINAQRNEANEKLPDLYLGGSFGFQGFKYKFNKEQAYALGQVGLTYKLFDGGYLRSKSEESRLDAQLAQNQYENSLQLIRMEIINAWNELDAAKFAFNTAKKNVDTARAIFRITDNKYKAGQVLLLEFLDAQNRVTTAELQQLISWTNVLLKEASLRKAAGL